MSVINGISTTTTGTIATTSIKINTKRLRVKTKITPSPIATFDDFNIDFTDSDTEDGTNACDKGCERITANPTFKPPCAAARNKSHDKRSGADMPIFKMDEYLKITNKLSLPHLKLLCKTYGLKTTGTRPVLSDRARSHCLKQCAIIALQRVVRGHIGRTYVDEFIKNPVYARVERAVNDSDFYTMDDFAESCIPHYQVFRFRDGCDNKIYQFNVASFFKLLKTAYPHVMDWSSADACNNRQHQHHQQHQQLLNPYNRSPISMDVVQLFFMKISHSRMMRHPVCTAFEDDVLTPAQTVEMRIVELFQDINTLGNYADSAWFSGLKHPQHIWFIQELYDIWTYRAELGMQTKCRICPPYGLLFLNSNQIAVMNEVRTVSYDAVRDINISTIDRLVRSGLTEDDRKLGAFYVLSALTLVSPGARDALPWLYQSVATTVQHPEYYYPAAPVAPIVHALPVAPAPVARSPLIVNNAPNAPNATNAPNAPNNATNTFIAAAMNEINDDLLGYGGLDAPSVQYINQIIYNDLFGNINMNGGANANGGGGDELLNPNLENNGININIQHMNENIYNFLNYAYMNE